MLRRLPFVKWGVRLSIRPKSTAVFPEIPQAPKGGEGPGLFRSIGNYLRSGGREDLTAIGIGVGGLATGASAIYFIVGSVQSSHEKISILTKDLEKERALRVKDNESAEKLRVKDNESAEKGIQKERELREKDAVLLTKDIEKERALRVKDNESAEKLRVKDNESAEKLRFEGIQKERELREKDVAIMRAERIAYEQELRAAKLELQNARGK